MKFPRLLLVAGLLACPGCDRARTLVSSLGKPKNSTATAPVDLIVNLREDEVGSFCRQRGKLTLVEYHADWNGQSMQLVPILQRITAEHGGRVLVGRIDFDKSKTFASAQDVKNLPDVRFYSDGHLVDRFVGLPEDDEIRERIIAQIKKLPAPEAEPPKAPEAEKPIVEPMKKGWLPSGLQRR